MYRNSENEEKMKRLNAIEKMKRSKSKEEIAKILRHQRSKHMPRRTLITKAELDKRYAFSGVDPVFEYAKKTLEAADTILKMSDDEIIESYVKRGFKNPTWSWEKLAFLP